MAARYDNHEGNLPIQVVDGVGPNLMGRDWLGHFKPELLGENPVQHITDTTLQAVLDKHTTVFKNELGCMKGVEVELQLQANAKPKPHTVPFIRKKLAEEELIRLESLGIISTVKTSKWAIPIVPVMKQNGTMRVFC